MMKFEDTFLKIEEYDGCNFISYSWNNGNTNGWGCGSLLENVAGIPTLTDRIMELSLSVANIDLDKLIQGGQRIYLQSMLNGE